MKRNVFSAQNFVWVVLLVAIVFIGGRLANQPTSVVAVNDEVTATLIPRFISLPVETAVINNGASYELNGGADLSGMAFPDSGFPRFSTGFSLPPDYAEGTDIVVRITWGNSAFNATSCGVRLRSNGVSAFRPNVSPIYSEGVFTGDINFSGSEVTLAMPTASGQIRQTIMTIPGTDSLSNPRYKAGDNIVWRLARDDGDIADTCVGKLFILGINATYQGLDSYLPLVIN